MDRTRRSLLGLAAGYTIWGALPALSAAAGETTVRLVPKLTAGVTQRFTAVVEVEGTLRLNPDGKQVTTTPLKVLADVTFDQKLLTPLDAKSGRAARHYSTAKAAIKVDKNGLTNTVREDVRLICIQRGEDSATLYSPLGPLVRDELELLKLPGEPIVWNSLLPETAVKAGDTWKLADATLAIFLGIDVVTSNEVTAKLVKVDAKVAAMELDGAVSGAIGGVATDLEVKAKYNFDFAQKQVNWLALGIKEKRAIGHAEPGYEITSRVRIGAETISQSPQLADSLLKQFPMELKEGSTLLTHDSKEGAFTLLHDRRWHVVADNQASTILRLVDRGDLIAQCNISRLKDMPEGKQLALDAFQEEVGSTLGKGPEGGTANKTTERQVVNADQATTDNGLRQLRVVVAGAVQEVPVQWTYYHLSDSKGRNIALVFTMDARLVERFADLDRSMISSLELRSRAADAAPPTEENPQEAPAAETARK
jgi:hypothetical protein